MRVLKWLLILFKQTILNKIRARCVKENIASSKVLEKAGMKFNCIKRDHIEKMVFIMI